MLLMLFGLLAVLVISALVVGQVRVVSKAYREQSAGWGRFTYQLANSPVRFYLMFALEMALLLGTILYVSSTFLALLR